MYLPNTTLIGMSNTGKTHWFDQITQQRYRHNGVCCDKRIAKLLNPVLLRGRYGVDTTGMARWMGQPGDRQYDENSRRYLDLEVRVMRRVLRKLRDEPDGSLVIDTTGSVIYTGEDILEELRARTTVVLLDAPQHLQDSLYQGYLSGPKPVVWGEGTFTPLPGEDKETARARCYPELLRSRNKKYGLLADLVLSYEELREPSFTVRKFVDKIKSVRK